MNSVVVVHRPSGRLKARALLLATMALMALIAMPGTVAASEPTAPANPTATTADLQRVIDIAKAKLGSRWSFAATGPSTFDCSGLVTYSFRAAGLMNEIGGKRRSAKGFYKWFLAQGRADKVVGLPGDLIVWGRFQHLGIYLGGGMAISTLINPYGVSIHPVSGYLGMPVKAYLHISRSPLGSAS
jgi:cell wall-associated NlpC family hydrolase